MCHKTQKNNQQWITINGLWKKNVKICKSVTFDLRKNEWIDDSFKLTVL